jgi:hypothetical protein
VQIICASLFLKFSLALYFLLLFIIIDVLLWTTLFAEDAISPNHASSNGRDLQNEVGKSNFIPSVSIRVLQEIAMRLSDKVCMVSALK